MISKKDRRHSGWSYPRIVNPIEDMFEVPYYNDWDDYRDGMRHGNLRDKSKLRSLRMCCAEYMAVDRWNKKIKNQIRIRKFRIK